VSNRFFPCIGNHDWALGYFGTNGLTPYLDYFTLPGNERYYSYRYGNLEVFALASDQMEPDGATATSQQARWLHRALAASTATWRLVYFHESPYSSGYLHGSWTQESTNMLWPYREWGATAILAGHDHLYERVHTNGLTYFVVGTGGDRLDMFHFPLTAGSKAHYNASHGALRIDATETNLLFRFFNTANLLIDSWRIEARPAPPRSGPGSQSNTSGKPGGLNR
jgi:tartrate-resistant acid phosphatase type 5